MRNILTSQEKNFSGLPLVLREKFLLAIGRLLGGEYWLR
jgi:hypothetical protein